MPQLLGRFCAGVPRGLQAVHSERERERSCNSYGCNIIFRLNLAMSDDTQAYSMLSPNYFSSSRRAQSFRFLTEQVLRWSRNLSWLLECWFAFFGTLADLLDAYL